MENKVWTAGDTLKKSSLALERDREGCGVRTAVGHSREQGVKGPEETAGDAGSTWKQTGADEGGGGGCGRAVEELTTAPRQPVSFHAKDCKVYLPILTRNFSRYVILMAVCVFNLRP